MPIALSEFWTRIVKSGIAASEDCKRLASAFRQRTGSPPSEALPLAKFLVRCGEISEYQARALLRSETPPVLRLGPFDRVGDAAPPPLSRWLPMRHRESGRSGYILRLNADDATRVEAAVGLSAASMQTLELLEHAGGADVFLQLPKGKALSTLLPKESDPELDPIQIGVALAAALDQLHQADLVHGEVCPDRVWIKDDGTPLLLYDPMSPPWPERASGEKTDDTKSGARGLFDNPAEPLAFAAPELEHEGASASPSTDYYALGCLLFRLATGRLAFNATSRHQWFQQHRTERPPELESAVSNGAAGDPLLRIVAHLMAKSPSARFHDARQLMAAFEAAASARDALAPADRAATPSPDTHADRAAAALASPDDAGIANDVKATRDARPGAVDEAESPHRGARVKEAAAGYAVRPDGRTASSTTRKPVPESDAVGEEPTPPAKGKRRKRHTPQSSDKTVLSAANNMKQTPNDKRQPADGPTRAPVGRNRRKRNRGAAPLVLGGLAIAALMLLIMVLARPSTSDSTERNDSRTFRPPEEVPRVAADEQETPSVAEVESPQHADGYELVENERLLWVPPYPVDDAPPLDLLPPGPGIVATVRLEDLLAREQGQRCLQTFSPELSAALESIAQRTNVPPATIRRLTIALHPGAAGVPEVSLAVELAEAQPLDALKKAWNVAEAQTAQGRTILVGDEADSDAFYVRQPRESTAGVSAFAVGSVARISEVAENEGYAIPLPGALEKLWNQSSGEAHFIALITPNFLFADARKLTAKLAAGLEDPLKQWLIPDAAAWLLTATFDDQRLYLETRVAPAGSVGTARWVRRLDETIERWPAWAARFLLEAIPDPSWRLLSTRLPQMMQFVGEHTRTGVSEGQAVANAYLPARSADQIGLAVLLALRTPTAPQPQVETPDDSALTLDQMLDRKMSVSFGQESLKSALELVVSEFERFLPPGSDAPRTELLGTDLEKMGITQNQQVRNFEKQDVPFRTVLTDLMLEANPDRTASGPSDPKQALVWAVANDPQSPGKAAIFVTTRQAAEGNYELPREFHLDQ